MHIKSIVQELLDKKEIVAVKSDSYYEFYMDLFYKTRMDPYQILEVGTAHGCSAKYFSLFFPNANIITIDREYRHDLSSKYANVKFYQCDQTDSKRLLDIVSSEFAEGIDIVIDDASHYGYHSKVTFDTVYHLVKPERYYILEDWGTGYWPGWPDGSRYEKPRVDDKRIISHDYGLVGFAKSLIDEVSEEKYNHDWSDPLDPSAASAKSIEYRFGMAVIKKK